MRSIIGLSVMATILVAVCVFIYYLIYARSVNRRIQSGQMTGRRMIDIPKILIIAVIVVLILYSVIITQGMKQSQRVMEENYQNRNNIVEIDPEKFIYLSYMGTMGSDDASYARAYSKEVNEGYAKSEFQDGDFTFTVFTRLSEHDDFHPDFICFAEYVGAIDASWSVYENIEFLDLSGEAHPNSIGYGGGEVKKEYLFVGNLNADCAGRINIAFLDAGAEQAYMEADQKAYEADNGEFPSPMDYASTRASVEIVVE